MGRRSCSHYLPLCSPSSGRARQRRFVLTIAANEGLGVRRAAWLFSITNVSDDLRAAEGRPRLEACSPFSKLFWIAVFRNTSPPATFEKAGGGNGATRSAAPSSSDLISQQFCSFAAIVSTNLRWRARPDDGEHSGRQCEHGRCPIGS